MERFVFVAAVTIAVIFGVGAVFGGPHFGWNFNVNADDDEPRRAAAIVEVSPGRMEAAAFAGERLRIRNVAAIVVVTPEDRTDFLVEIDNSAGRAPMPTVVAENGRVVVDGQLRGRISSCEEGGGASLRGYGDLSPEDLPRITIRAPRSVVLDRSGAGSTEIGASQDLDFDLTGCGAANVGDVAGAFNLDIAGAGDVAAGSAGSFNADVAGAGDITLGAIAQGAEIDLSGASNVTIASLTGDFSMDMAGAGNVTVRGGTISTGDIDIAGAGDVDIAAPVQSLKVSIMGVGDVDVAAAVGDLDADIAGPGTVTVQSLTGALRQSVAGPGSVRVGR